MAADILRDPPVIWKTKLRSLKDGVPIADQVAYCLEGRRVGIGWGVEGMRGGASLERVVAAIKANPDPGWGFRAAATVRRFGAEAAVGDFVWTRDLEGRFRLGRIAGDYRYENSATAKRLDTHQVRDARWARRPLNDLEVPGAVVRGFSGISTSFSRIHDHGARVYTAWIWKKLHGRRPAPLDLSPEQVLRHLDPYDLEDLIYVWMQVHEGYVALPKARRTDTPAYEWTMINRRDHTEAILQVKSGDQPVNLSALARAATSREMKLYAYSVAGRYEGSPRRQVIRIETKRLLAFAAKHPELLPPRVRVWFELSRRDR